jgi:poly(3-hydroxybutyrate) depolymerase
MHGERVSRLTRLLPVAAIVTIVLATAALSGQPALAAVGAADPTITLQPGSVDLYQGQNAVFTAAASRIADTDGVVAGEPG